MTLTDMCAFAKRGLPSIFPHPPGRKSLANVHPCFFSCFPNLRFRIGFPHSLLVPDFSRLCSRLAPALTHPSQNMSNFEAGDEHCNQG